MGITTDKNVASWCKRTLKNILALQKDAEYSVSVRQACDTAKITSYQMNEITTYNDSPPSELYTFMKGLGVSMLSAGVYGYAMWSLR